MPSTRVRPFHRSDRQHLTRLVNAHVATILPGAQLSTQRILAQLEAEPEEIITERWVDDRTCLVAEADGRPVGAMLLVHHAQAPDTSESLRGLGGLRWLLGEPDRPEALDDLLAAAAAWARALGSPALAFDGVLPVPGCFGLPDSWPHVARALDRAGFDDGFDDLHTLAATPRRAAEVPVARRSVGHCGTRFALTDAEGEAGYIDIESDDADRSAFPGSGRHVVIGNLHTRDEDADGVHAALLDVAGDWCARAGATQLMVDVPTDKESTIPWWIAHGFERVGSCRLGRRLLLG